MQRQKVAYAEAMELLYKILLLLHLLSWAIVIGAWLTHLRPPVVAKGVFHGALAALVTGILMVGIASSSDAVTDPNNAKIGVKLVVALLVVVLAWLGQKKGDRVEPGIVHAVGGLVVVNVAVAVLWS